MTVTLGKKTINLGWEVAVTIVLALAVFFWKGGSISNDFLRNQADIKKELVEIKNNQNVKNKKDSLQDIQIDTLKASLSMENKKYNALKKSFDSFATKKRITYVTERYDADGHMHTSPVRKP